MFSFLIKKSTVKFMLTVDVVVNALCRRVFYRAFLTDSDTILKILSVDFCGKVKVNSDSSSKIV